MASVVLQLANVTIFNVHGFGKRGTPMVPDQRLIIAEKIIKHFKEQKLPAVVNISISSPFSATANDAVEIIVNKGVAVVVAAGNERGDACMRSPASTSNVITVEASDRKNKIYWRSNYGRCTNIFAPGVDVRAFNSRNIEHLATGTSVASPIVAASVAQKPIQRSLPKKFGRRCKKTRSP